MASTEDVQKLASLARLSIPEEKLPAFAAEFDAILAYVGKLDELNVAKGTNTPALRNVFREDGEPHESGKYTEKIAAQFPSRKGDALSVKQIISHD
jgi:aspartyl/glutamyl-tRNA(Asn/Gln) amidotransferase C subunit